MNKNRFKKIMSGEVQDAKPEEVYSVFIRNGKERSKRVILHYVNNLPPTYTISKKVIKHNDKLKDIRFNELKNKAIYGLGETLESSVNVSSENGIVEKEDWYLVPLFIKVKHHQRLKKVYDNAYSITLKKQKGVDLLSAHRNAEKEAERSLNVYAQWVFDNNKKLVKDFPEYWSEEKKEIEIETEVKEKSFFDKVKSLFTNE